METAETSSSEACSEFHLTECEAMYKVKNFVAAVAATDAVFPGRPSFREISSGPIMSAGDFKFAIVIVWGVDPDGNPDTKQRIGVCARRADDSDEKCTLSMRWNMLNQNDSKSVAGVDKGFYRHKRGFDRGIFPWSDTSQNLTLLSDVLDPSKGWLHDGALQVRMKFVVVTNFTATSTSAVDQTACLQEVCDDFRKLLDSKLFADVTLQVGDTNIDAHCNVLATRSPVFAAMLSSSMQEGREKHIVIRDLEVNAVREMLTYLYAGTIKQETLESDDLCLGLLQAAHRYEVEGLVSRCANAIGKRLEVSTVCDRLEFADLLGCERLKSRCLGYIYQHSAEVQNTEAYTKLCRQPRLLMDIIAFLSPPAKRRRTGQEES